MLIFWTENIAIGIFNILKMVTVMRKNPEGGGCIGVFLIPFFIIHYFGFCFGHGLFIAAILSQVKLESIGVLGPLHELVQSWTFIYGLIIMLVSHSILFKQRFIDEKGYFKTTIEKLMVAPYKRIIVVHLVISALALLIIKYSSDSYLLVIVFVLFKIAFDFYIYRNKAPLTEDKQF